MNVLDDQAAGLQDFEVQQIKSPHTFYNMLAWLPSRAMYLSRVFDSTNLSSKMVTPKFCPNFPEKC